jgi:trehalose-phosphatase
MLPDDLSEALSVFAGQKNILVALDFDGTLAPLVDDPMDSRMIPQARSALEALTSLPGITVALVTGRAIESITQVGDPLDEWYLVGSHGIEVVTPLQRDGYTTLRLVPPGLITEFEEVVGAHPGSRIEMKPFGVALHTRGVADPIARAAEAAAHAVCEAWGADVVVRTGHGIVECSVKHATKGDGLLALREATGADAIFFAGDDLTDEDGFAVMTQTDVAVRVAGGETIAPYRLDNARAVAEALWRLHDLRTAVS